MKNLTLSLDERLIERARRYVETRGVSLNGFIAEILARAIGANTQQRHATTDLLSLAKKIAGDSKARKWTREELHER